jgi:hypothetical protein
MVGLATRARSAPRRAWPRRPACPPSWRGYRAEGSKNQKGPTRSTRAGPVRSTRRGRARPSDTVPGGSAAGSRPSPTYFRASAVPICRYMGGLAIARRVPTATCWAKPRPYCRQSNRRASSIRSGCRHWSTCGYWRIDPVVSYRATGLSASPRALGRPVGNECMGCVQPVDGTGGWAGAAKRRHPEDRRTMKVWLAIAFVWTGVLPARCYSCSRIEAGGRWRRRSGGRANGKMGGHNNCYSSQ